MRLLINSIFLVLFIVIFPSYLSLNKVGDLKKSVLQEKEIVKIRFHFSLQYINSTHLTGRIKNTFKIIIDDKTVFEQTLTDTTHGHNPQPEPYFIVTKGEHKIRVILKENGKFKDINKDFEKDIGLSVYYDGWDKKQILILDFPFDQSFFIE
jgi:hypothetical protein